MQQMLLKKNGPSLQSPLRLLSVLVLHVLLTHSCQGQSHLVGPPQPIVVKVGDEVILPCHLEPAVDVSAMTLEWTRPDLNDIFVHVRRTGEELPETKHPSYKDRTSMSVNELKHGNISVKLSDVKPSDGGRYKCYIPKLDKQSFVELVVGAASLPVISLLGIDRNRGGVILNCGSAGWYPEPEVFWLDGEGNLLSDGPTEIVRGPDDLYTVSSRVTVEKRHNNSFTCRVHQKNSNQTRETHIHVSDDFFKTESSSASTVGLAVSLAFFILLLPAVVVFMWRINITKTKRSSRVETNKGEKNNKTEDQFVTEEEREREQLMKDETVQMKVLKKEKEKKKNKHLKKQNSEQQQKEEEEQRRKEAENKVKTLKEELKTKKTELEKKQDELQQLHEEKQRNEEELKNLKEHLEKKNKELDEIKASMEKTFKLPFSHKKEEKKNEAEQEVETLKKNLETLETKIKQFEEKQAEVQQIQDEVQRIETSLQTLMKDLESNNMELFEENSLKAEEDLKQVHKLTEEKRRREKEQQELQTELKKKIKELNQQLSKKEQDEEKFERSLKELVTLLNKKLENLQEEKKKMEEEVEKPQGQNTKSDGSAKRFTVEVERERDGKHLLIRNTSQQDQHLQGWTLKTQINNEEPNTLTVKESNTLRPGENVTVEVPSYDSSRLPSNPIWTDLTSPYFGEKLQVTLFNSSGQIQYDSSQTERLTE